MERNKCKLCSRRFSSGRALGGHMRSHLANMPLPPKTPQKEERKDQKPFLGGSTESTSSLSSSEEEEEEVREKLALGYGLRENPKKSFRLVDPEFYDAGSVYVVVQDRESETESTKKPTRTRSKRTRRMMKPSSIESLLELEPVSSVSDASPEEDLALSLVMLSRDVWTRSDDSVKSNPTPGRFRCEICYKFFATSQALGAHKISHKKMKIKSEERESESEQQQQKQRNLVVMKNVDRKKMHECPFCGKVFGSGQALGGHKRSHILSSSTVKMVDSLVESNSAKFQENLLMIDLNLPAPMEDDDHEDEDEDEDEDEGVILSITSVPSTVSDADFINPINEH